MSSFTGTITTRRPSSQRVLTCPRQPPRWSRACRRETPMSRRTPRCRPAPLASRAHLDIDNQAARSSRSRDGRSHRRPQARPSCVPRSPSQQIRSQKARHLFRRGAIRLEVVGPRPNRRHTETLTHRFSGLPLGSPRGSCGLTLSVRLCVPRGSRRVGVVNPPKWVDLPAWLLGPARAVLADIQGDVPIPGLSLRVTEPSGPDGLVLGLFEPGGHGGGSFVSRALEPVELLVRIAEGANR